MSYLQRLYAVNNADPADYRPFVVAGRTVGWITDAFAALLAPWPEVFAVDPRGVALAPPLTHATPAERSAEVARVTATLRDEGHIAGWRDEHYPVAEGFGAPPLMTLERAAVVHFGVTGYGVHVNGFVRRRDGLYLWVAQRAKDRFVAPGKLDQLAAGGQPVDLSLWDNVRKECREEANLPPPLLAGLTAVGTINYYYATLEGLRPDVIFTFDVELPEEFTPANTDGEVLAFELWPVDRVATVVAESDAFKFNSALVVIDFLIRHGALSPEHPDYVAITSGLRVRLPFKAPFDGSVRGS